MVFSAPRLSTAFSRVLPILIYTTSLALGAAVAQLPANEVAALKDIAASLGKTNWDFSKDPCGVDGGWGIKNTDNSVTCDNSGNDTVPHVISIRLKREGLNGTLPPHLTRLPYLLDFDVTRNYLNGTIPSEWGAHPKLLNISVLGNRLTGPIPKELGNISTLQSLVLMINQFSGDLPSDLGNLSRLERLHLTSNNFTGALPATFAKLTALKELLLGDNQFQGNIPDFVQSFTHLELLIIQASGLRGPIPSGIGLLTNLSDLRITDLNQTESPIPQLNSTKIKQLILRNCNLIGGLPEGLSRMENLKRLDLSFNKLNGEIPSTFNSLVNQLDYMLLTGNWLTGVVPEWMLMAPKNVDLSYNNFTAGGTECQKGNVNLFASSSEVDDKTLYSTTSGLVSCLKNFKCPQSWDFVSINCGGGEVVIGDTTYYDDTARASASSFFQSADNNWAYSSTGYFPDDNNVFDSYIASNNSILLMDNAQLYTTARLSPLSLTYYGFCLNNGNYSVSLHFSEIVFTNDKNYSSLGRRIFDVYIQGNKVMEDFNIEAAARGVGKPIVKNFNTTVSNGTLEVRFYWAGKGTTAIPDRGVFGPLISAISMKNLEPKKQSSLSAGTVAGIVAAIVFAIIMTLLIIWWKGCFGWRDTRAHDLKGLDLQTGSFTLRQIKAATDNFNTVNKIGEGGFGSVYKGILLDGTPIAVKQLSSKSKQGNREFVNEIGMISALQHPHLVKLYGCCIEGNQLLLIYEYMENNSLARALFGPEEYRLKLDWPTRHKICLGIAKGLAYLHEESRLKIVHRDIKATNVLLDVDLNPKISDFGLAKLNEEENTHISTRIAGTYGYMAPEYAMRGYLTEKADIYSFGIVALEIVSGCSNTSFWCKDECFYLLDWARVLKEKGNLIDLVDQSLGSDFNEEEATVMINVALLCSNSSPVLRPAMSLVVSMLEGKTRVPAPLTEGGVIDEDEFKAMRKHFKGDEGREESERISQSRSVDGLWTGTTSSTSVADLHPMDSDNWHSRD